jgi:hypothetical protein
LIDPDFDPLALLEELSEEVVRLNNRQLQLERFFQELANQHTSIANHLGGQSQDITELYKELGKILHETKQSTSTNSQG